MSDPAKGRTGRQRATSDQPATRHDWQALKARFVAGDLSLRAFAAAEDMDETTVAKRASRDGWTAAREASRSKVAAGVVKAHEKRRIRDESELDGEAHEAAGKMMAKACEMLDVCETPQELKATVEAMKEAYRLARITARFTADPTPAVAEDEFGGDMWIRRRAADGTEVEASVGGAQTHHYRPVGPDADADAVGVPD